MTEVTYTRNGFKLRIHVNLTTARRSQCVVRQSLHHAKTKAQLPHKHWIIQQIQGNALLQEIKAK